MIKLYTLSTCVWCKKTKKLLTDKGVSFTDVDVDLLVGEEQEKALQEIDKLVDKRSFPIIVANGQVIQGYNEEKILGAIGNGE